MTAPPTPSEPQALRYGLRITRADDAGGAVVRMSGELELATVAEARDALQRAMSAPSQRIVVDLRTLDFLDSTGIHALVQAHDRCRTHKRTLALLLSPGQVQRTLEVCGVLDMFNHPTPEAIAA